MYADTTELVLQNDNAFTTASALVRQSEEDALLLQTMGFLPAGHTHLQAVALQEDVPVHISALSEGDVDIYVYDRFGELVASDNSEGIASTCEWMPLGTGEYLIKLVNPTAQPTAYLLNVNLPRYAGTGLKQF